MLRRVLSQLPRVSPMRAFGSSRLLAVVVCMASANIICAQERTGWRKVRGDTIANFYVSTDEPKWFERTRVEVVSRRLYHRDRVDTILTRKPFRSVEELNRFDCEGRRFAVMGAMLENATGTVVFAEDFSSLVDTAWTPVALSNDRRLLMLRACALTEGLTNRWRLIGQSPGVLTFLDTTSVRALGSGIVELWAQKRFTSKHIESTSAGTMRITYSLVRYEIDCPQRLYRMVGDRNYSETGQVGTSHEWTNEAYATFKPIPPETVAEAYSSSVCK